MQVEEIYHELLCSTQKLNRDKGVIKLTEILNQFDHEEWIDKLLAVLKDQTLPWNNIFGSLILIKEIISHPIKDHYVSLISNICCHHMEHPEVRVREQCGSVLALLFKHSNDVIGAEIKQNLLNGISLNVKKSQTSLPSVPLKREIIPTELPDHSSGVSADKIMEESSGWRHLDTWLGALNSMLEVNLESFGVQFDENFSSVVDSAFTCDNRFVKEKLFRILGSLFTSATYSSGKAKDLLMTESKAKQIKIGLSDNWSQVRRSAVEATSRFFQLIKHFNVSFDFFSSMLLPPLCLNRYYLGEGVRLLAQKVWSQVTNQNGREMIEKNFKATVEYYLEQCVSDNHAVRECACVAVNELITKIDANIIRPYVNLFFEMFISSFADDCWPVRDAACLSSSKLVLTFPEEGKSFLDQFWSLYLINLRDSISYVRSGAAVGITNLCSAYTCLFPKILTTINGSFSAMKNQSPVPERFRALDTGRATFSVVKAAYDNDYELHSNNQMYSCGSLAPKFARNQKLACGCSCPSVLYKKAEEWEECEGCLFLFEKLFTCENEQVKDMCRKSSEEVLKGLKAAASFRDYTRHFDFLKSLCGLLPGIAVGLGVKQFKSHLSDFFEPIFYTLEADSDQVRSSAVGCLRRFSQLIGRIILRSRVEEWNPRYLPLLDDVLDLK